MNWLKTNEVPFRVIAPQDQGGYWPRLDPFVDYILKEYPSDLGSLHMAGLSSGGYGIRDFIRRNSEVYKLFSTFTPMSTNLQDAVGNVDRIVLNNQKVWCHQGEIDGDPNAVYACANFIKAGRVLDPNRFSLTVYKGMKHVAWEEVYDSSGRDKAQLTVYNNIPLKVWGPSDPNWFQWLEANRKTPIVPPVDPPVKEKILENYFEANELVFVGEKGTTFRATTNG